MSKQQRADFEASPWGELAGWPEIGSRAFVRACGAKADEFAQVGEWVVVQPGRYRYSVSPIKRDVKRKTLLPAGVPEIFSDIQPPTTLPTPLCWQLLDRIGLSRSGLTSRGASGPRALFSRWHHVRCHDGAVRFSETHKLNLVAELPTIVLLETRGLQLSSVVRGGIG